MRKVLFWDFDGTLVRPEHIWSRSLFAALDKLTYGIALEEVRAQLSSSYTWHFPDSHYPDHAGEKWWPLFYSQLGPLYDIYDLTQEERDGVNSALRSCILDAANYRLYDDAVSVLTACTNLGYKNYMLSNNYPELPYVVEAMGIGHFFEKVIASAQVGYEKPRPELFAYALGAANDPEIRYMIGDNPVADMKGGKAAGMTTILVHKPPCPEADYTCAQLSDIPDILKRHEEKAPAL
ncbi:MAG: HAD family hydrolase [Christensenellales bacterium]|jgi:HAD superfamily hydrolase (TIGR01549 family)